MSESLYPAEFVFPGHPDKLADAIADAIVEAAAAREARALVGVEVAVHRHRVFITGRVACEGAAEIDIPHLVRDVYRSAGYGGEWDPEPDNLVIETDLCLGPLEDGESEFRALSDDQAICVGYAIDRPETQYLPMEQFLVYRMARRLHRLRSENPELRLGPDGKVILGIAEDGPKAYLAWFSCSLQQKMAADDLALHRTVRQAVVDEMDLLARTIPGLSPAVPDQLTVNGAGAFEVGGPEGDNGLSGKKLVMDAYGPRVPIGGGAWSGKDFYKADRAGALHARRIAKLLALTGIAHEATVFLSWQPGDSQARILRCIGASMDSAQRCANLMSRHLCGSGDRWGRQTGLANNATWGHFTEEPAEWEKLPIPA
jgi:S-adenosylmethionine synthetase